MGHILVTGGAGFLGSHLSDVLLQHGNTVTCLDNFYTGRRSNVSHLLPDPHFKLVHHDVVNPFFVEVDAIYHLACPASPIHYQRNPVRTLLTAVQGTQHMLDLARETGARLVLASTSEVYGDPQVHPQSETYWGHVNPVGKRACYDEGKRCAETLAVCYRERYQVDVRIARIFNTYGPRMLEEDGRVISNFCVQALDGQALTVYGDGQQTRSFCYVSDLIDGLMRLMALPHWVSPINLGNDSELSMHELASTILQLAGSRSEIQYLPLPADDPTRRRPDISRAADLLGWRPRIDVRVGLKRTLRYFAQRRPRDGNGRAQPHPTPHADRWLHVGRVTDA